MAIEMNILPDAGADPPKSVPEASSDNYLPHLGVIVPRLLISLDPKVLIECGSSWICRLAEHSFVLSC